MPSEDIPHISASSVRVIEEFAFIAENIFWVVFWVVFRWIFLFIALYGYEFLIDRKNIFFIVVIFFLKRPNAWYNFIYNIVALSVSNEVFYKHLSETQKRQIYYREENQYEYYRKNSIRD